MSCGEVVKHQQLTWLQQNALLDRIQVKTPLGQVVSLLGNGFELHTAEEATATGARQRRRAIDCLD